MRRRGWWRWRRVAGTCCGSRHESGRPHSAGVARLTVSVRANWTERAHTRAGFHLVEREAHRQRLPRVRAVCAVVDGDPELIDDIWHGGICGIGRILLWAFGRGGDGGGDGDVIATCRAVVEHACLERARAAAGAEALARCPTSIPPLCGRGRWREKKH